MATDIAADDPEVFRQLRYLKLPVLPVDEQQVFALPGNLVMDVDVPNVLDWQNSLLCSLRH